jgi:hypothetical protein
MAHETKELLKDSKGIEYYLIKANRVNWIVERVSDGARLQGPGRMFTPVGIKQVETAAVSPLIRIGAVVKVNEKATIWSYSKFLNTYSRDQKFVIMGFGKVPGEFKIIELGGNARNTYYNLHGKDLVLA